MIVYIGGEDFVTKQIAKRLVRFCVPEKNVEFEDLTLRTHGTRALETLAMMKKFARQYPVVSVFDTDGDCVIELLRKYMSAESNIDYAAINFAIDEAEAWLMADREGMAEYFKISVDKIPDKKVADTEISCVIPYKTSLFILQEIAPLSRDLYIRDMLAVDKLGKKPATYNSVWGKYIDEIWDIEAACVNSVSLTRAVERIKRMLNKKETV